MEVILRQRSKGSGPRSALRCSTFSQAFTLIELLVVITIIVILMGLLFPAFRGVQDQAKKTQTKNDLAQIVTAVNAFYTEYGKYPITTTTDTTFGPGGSPTSNEALFNALRGLDVSLNPRKIVFLSPPDAKDAAKPRSGIGTTTSTGQYFDPWGKNYVIRIDGDYDNQIDNPYLPNSGAGPAKIRQGVIAWSLGTDQDGGSGDKKTGKRVDDVLSWQ